MRWIIQGEYVRGDVWWATTLADVVYLRCSGQGGFSRKRNGKWEAGELRGRGRYLDM